MIIILVTGIMAITIERGYIPSLPRLTSQGYKNVLDSTGSLVYNNSLIGRQYGGFRIYIDEQKPYLLRNILPKKMQQAELLGNTFNKYATRMLTLLLSPNFPAAFVLHFM